MNYYFKYNRDSSLKTEAKFYNRNTYLKTEK